MAIAANAPGLAGKLVEGVQPTYPLHEHALAADTPKPVSWCSSPTWTCRS